MSFFGAGTATNTFGAAATAGEPKDVEVANPPPDGISSIAFSPQADLLSVASWSNEVRIYEIDGQGNSQPKAAYSHEGPVLEVCWSKDGTKIFSGGADKAGRMYDVATGQSSQVAAHDAPIRKVSWVQSDAGGPGMLATGSWDKTVKYWDLRQQTPAVQVQLPERVYAMDAVYPLMVVGTAGRKIHIYNLSNPTVEFKQLDSPLKWQTRTIACFNDGTGYAVGSIEGRCAIQHVEEKQTSMNFAFKCHRKDNTATSRLSASSPAQIYSVNDIKFHKQHGTFATAGSDGTINMWDKDSKTRLKSFDNRGGPITSVAYNRTGQVFAYAVSYDWSQGHTGATPGQLNKVMLHPCKDEEVKRKPKK